MANIHWLAVLVASLVYFFFGSLWYQALFSKVWARESGIKMDNPPTGAALMQMMMKSFLGNLQLLCAPSLQITVYIRTDWWKQLLERRFQVTICIETVDDALSHAANRFVQFEPAKLMVQVIDERLWPRA